MGTMDIPVSFCAFGPPTLHMLKAIELFFFSVVHQGYKRGKLSMHIDSMSTMGKLNQFFFFNLCIMYNRIKLKIMWR
jgi:hypothetical protein